MWRIKDWNRIFENNRSRVIESTTWVPMPNKHDSDGYLQLLDHDHGASHYGAWCALVQVASKCKPRGTLVRDGKPHTVDSLARQTRIGTHVFREAIPRFTEIGWIEDVDESCVTFACRSPDAGVLGALSTNGRNGRKERKEGKERIPGRSGPAGPVGPVGFSISVGSDSDKWQAARRLASDACQKLWPGRRAPLSPADRELIAKAALLAVVRFSEDWFVGAVDEVVNADAKKPIALLKTCLWKRPRAEGLDLNAMLDAVVVPQKGGETKSAKSP